MGTNYYLHFSGCACCGHTPEPWHIGKSSAGWYFNLHVIPENGINTLDDWLCKFNTTRGQSVIVSESGNNLSVKEMMDIIMERSWPTGRTTNDIDRSWYRDNYAEPGINNLVRFKAGHAGCIGHGDGGPWSLIEGEFS